MVPLMKCCFCGSSHEFQRPRGYIFLFLSLTSKLSGTGRVGMTKLRGHQVQRWMLFTTLLLTIKTMESPQDRRQNIFQAVMFFLGPNPCNGQNILPTLAWVKRRSLCFDDLLIHGLHPTVYQHIKDHPAYILTPCF